MRTKTLLVASAVALTAAITSSQAQTIYSANTVGYANTALTPGGFELVTPTFDLDGTGTNNTITTVVGTNFPSGTEVLVWTGAGYNSLSWESPGRGQPIEWVLNGTNGGSSPLNPGTGFFIQTTATNLTTTGNVLSGAQTLTLSGGEFSLVGSEIPYGGDIDTNLNYTPHTGDEILVWNGNGFTSYAYESAGRGQPVQWQPSNPQIGVGQGFFIQPASTVSWTETYTNN